MNILDKVSMIVYIAMGFIFLLAGIGIFVFMRIRKNSQDVDTAEGSEGKGLSFKESRDFIPIDDIRDGMIIDGKWTRFTAALLCAGSDFYSDTIEEKLRKQNGYISFWHTITTDVTYRQSTERVDLTYYREKLEKTYAALEEKLYFQNERYKTVRTDVEKLQEKEEPVPPALMTELALLQRQMDATDFNLRHLRSMMDHANAFQDTEKSVKAYLFSWQDAGGIMNSGLTGEALLRKAAGELDKMAGQFIRLLQSSGVTARRATTEELIDLVRRETHPHSGSIFSTADIYAETSWKDDVVQTDAAEKLRRQYVENLAERLVYGDDYGTV